MLIKKLKERWNDQKKKVSFLKCSYASLFVQRFWLYPAFFLIVNLAAVLCVSSSAWAIRATSGDGKIQIFWTAPTKNVDGSLLTDLAGYNVYRWLTNEDEKEKINSDLISGRSFIDSGLINGLTYSYEVTAVDFSQNESFASEMVFVTPTILPPAGFTARSDDGRIKLFWEQIKNPDIRGYHLYRTRSPGQNYRKITAIPIDGAFFEDMDVRNGINYYYVITSLSQAQESPYSEERAATPITLIPAEPSSLKALYTMGKVKLEWEPDANDQKVTGYVVYRRGSLDEKHFQKLTDKVIAATTYEDDSIEENKQYLYSVVGVYPNGVESTFPLEVACYTKMLYIASITDDTEGKAKKAGDIITLIMGGEPGCTASFDIAGLTMNQPMEEIKPGLYHQEFTIPGGRNLSGAELIGYLTDTDGHKTMKSASGKIYIKNEPPPPVKRVSGKINSYGWPEITWEPPIEKSFTFIELCRSASIVNSAFLSESALQLKKDITIYVDQKTDAGAKYYYSVRTVDEAGNRSPFVQSELLDLSKATEGPRIISVTDDTLGIPVKTGRVIRVAAEGDRGCKASFSIEKSEQMEESRFIIQDCPLEEIRPGMYQGRYTVKSSDQTKEEGADLIAQFVDRAERQKFAKSQKALRINVQTDDQEPPQIKDFEHNGSRVVGLSGKLVTGDNLRVSLFGEPGAIAYFTLGQDGQKVIMEESLINKEYQGESLKEYHSTYTIQLGDDGEEIDIYGYLTDQAGNTTDIKSDESVTIDTHPIITVSTEKKELLANNESNTEVLVQVEDVNGQPICGHHVALTMTTTNEYTDVIGGGDFGDMEKIDGKFAIDYDSLTDDRGQIEATYTSGFAAKTAIILAKDLDTGYIGVGYLSTYIENSVDLKLEPVEVKTLKKAYFGPGDAVSMIIKVKPQKITADGRSWARISVQLLDMNGNPVTKQYKVTFSPTNDEGELSPRSIFTDHKGEGHTIYTAGKSIGTVWIKAVASREGAPQVTKEASITLMSDAPAKIVLAAEPERLKANGTDSSHISFEVTDINDNPNPEATVQLRLVNDKGDPSNNGVLSDTTLYTDRSGETECIYTAGRKVGTVSVVAKVSSRIPTEEELLRAQGTLFVPMWSEEESNSFGVFWADEITDEEIGIIQEWLKDEGDEIEQGESVARIATEDHGDILVKAPFDGELLDIRIMAGEEVRIGQTIGIMDIDEEELD